MEKSCWSETLCTNKYTFCCSVWVYIHSDGFRKVMHMDTGIVKQERDGPVEFQHPYFKQGQDDLLENIKRKVKSHSTLYHELLSCLCINYTLTHTHMHKTLLALCKLTNLVALICGGISYYSVQSKVGQVFSQVCWGVLIYAGHCKLNTKWKYSLYLQPPSLISCSTRVTA